MSNLLSEMRPELVSEWSDKNLPLTPDRITYGSNKVVWWKGACGHEWQICSGARVIEGQANETTYDVTPYTAEQDDTDIELGIAIDQALDKAKLDAPPSTVKGIDAIRLMSEGYTCREIGEQIGATDKQVAAMVSKARKFLKSRKDVLDLAGNI